MDEGQRCGSEAKQNLVLEEEKSLRLPRGTAQRDAHLLRDEPWKFFCLAVMLITFLLVVILGVTLLKVLHILHHKRDELKQLDLRFLQGLEDAEHKRDKMQAELLRHVEALRVGNESSCEPCPTHWLAFQGSCYHISNIWRSWDEAKDDCALQEAHLAIFNSQAEQNFFTRNGSRTRGYWIGLRRLNPKEKYMWQDGSALTFTNLMEGNIFLGNCVCLTSVGQWSAHNCAQHTEGWICEKPQVC